MKRSTIITIVVIAIVILSASTIIVYHRGNMASSRAETGSEFDMDALETKKILCVDESVTESEGELILSLKWGDDEENIKMDSYQEGEGMPISYGTPSAFAVGDDGRVYVADTLNYRLKIYKDGLIVGSVATPERCSDSPNSMPFVLRDIDVDEHGNVYGLNWFGDKVVYIDVDKESVEPAFDNMDFNTLWTVDVLCDGSVLLRDNSGQNGTCVRRIDTDTDDKVVFEKALENIIDFDLYEYTDKYGDTISVVPYGVKEYQLTLHDVENESDMAVTNFKAQQEDPERETDVRLLGTDNDGCVYFSIMYTPLQGKKVEMGAEQWLANSSEYICRINIQSQDISTIRIQNTDYSLSSSNAFSAGKEIRIDNSGNVYQLDMDKDGYRILKYSFS
jgi:hypothetical protein